MPQDRNIRSLPSSAQWPYIRKFFHLGDLCQLKGGNNYTGYWEVHICIHYPHFIDVPTHVPTVAEKRIYIHSASTEPMHVGM